MIQAPPMRQGVSASRVGVGSGHFPTLLHFLTHRFPAVADWPQRLQRGDVLGAQGQPLAADSACTPGQLIWYWRQPPPEAPVPFDMPVLHQDEHLVVVDKPHFLPTTPGGRHLHETALVRLKHQLGICTLAPMHRLDRETAGVLVFTVQPNERNAYHALLREHAVHKVYEAIAPWRADLELPATFRIRLEPAPGRQFMQMQAVPGEPNAETHIEMIGLVDGGPQPLAHYRLTPKTGQRHQLRAQMNALGVAIVGDRIYPELLADVAPGEVPDYSRPLQLMARGVGFVDPFWRGRQEFVSHRRLLCATSP